MSKFVYKNFMHNIPILLVILGCIFSIVYYTGVYTNKIESLDKEFVEQARNIKSLERSVYLILGKLNIKGINVNSYLSSSKSNNLSLHETINGLSIISNSSPSKGKQYLMQHQGFTKEEAISVFKKQQ